MLPRLHAAEGDAIVRACREEARRAATGAGGRATPSAVTVPAAGPAQVEAWLQEQQACTANEQHAFLRVVGDHVIASLRCKTDPVTRPKKPLRWLLHGRPGVGKSYTLLKVRELLTDVLGFTQGVEFQYTALQGIMAAQYDGVTLHTLLGLDKRQQAVDGARHERLTRTIQHLRWLVIDEASMLSAHFLAEVECKLRLLLPRQSCDPASEADEAFGGINIILAGDFHQLDPPDNGVALCTPPSSRPGDKKIARAATSEYGLALLWDKRPELGFHGASELTTPHRCTEPWWMEVLEECRFGKLSANNHAFLHGKHTTVVGSALQGRASCGNPNCERLSGEACARRECGVCRRERRRRHRVVSDPRQCQEGKFAEAPFICPNNDVRYEVNKRRAQAHAAKTRQRTMWCPAKDRPSLRVAVANAGYGSSEVEVANRTRSEDGRVAWDAAVGPRHAYSADAEDRRCERFAARNSRAVGWLGSGARHGRRRRLCFRRPEDDAGRAAASVSTGEVAGERHIGTGYLRAKTGHQIVVPGSTKKKPQLGISRKQFPIVPCYAMTAHASQGLTLDAAIVDLAVGAEMSPVASYVALSRVRSPDNLLIFRPFPG